MSFLSSPADDTPSVIPEAERSMSADNAVVSSLCDLQLALLKQASLSRLINAGRTDYDLDAQIVQAERSVTEAFALYNMALCSQARGEPYRLLDGSRGVARAMRFRLAQNRTVASIEAHADRQVRLPIADSRLPAVASVGSL